MTIARATVSETMPPRVLFLSALASLLTLALGAAPAVSASSDPSDQGEERIAETGRLGYSNDWVSIDFSGKSWGDAHRAKSNLEIRKILPEPWFLAFDGRADRETRLPYDLTHWGAGLGVGYAFTPQTELFAKYRLDSYKVSRTGPNVDPVFQNAAGRNQTAALALLLRHDTRDNTLYATSGLNAAIGSDLAIEALGGDADFVRLSGEVAYYRTPFADGSDATWLDDVTFVEHMRLGWVESFGDTDAVPFYERYFVGGSGTVRGSRSRWLTPRGLEQQFVGGEIQLINNVEARVPVLARTLDRKLSAATFFDMGRAYRRFSDIGDVGVGVGGGLRYALKIGGFQSVIRADVALNLDNEGDNSTARYHLTVGMPF